MNASGDVVVGYSGDQAIRWTAATGMVGLGFVSGTDNSRALAVNADGSVVVGLAFQGGLHLQAFRWTAATGMADLGLLPGSLSSLSTAVNADGSVVVGGSGDQPFRWTASTGIVGLGFLPGEGSGNTATAYGVNADGSVVVGRSGSGKAFRWTASTGMQSVRDILTAHDTNLAGWSLDTAQAVSADGTIIVGSGGHLGTAEAWIAQIPKNAFALLDLAGSNRSIGSLVWGGIVTNSDVAPATLTAGSDNTSTTFNGVIQDGTSTTALTKTGTGTLTLTGNNTYTGGTTISAGTLQVGNGGTTGAIVGNILNNSIFAINRSDAYTFGGVISGSGAFEKLGTGTTVLTGANTYTGGTTISGGTLQLGDIANTGKIIGSVTNNATLNFISADTTSITSITNNGTTNFNNSTTAANASITNNAFLNFNNATAGNASILNNLGASTTFNSNSSGGSATITNNGGTTIFQGVNVNAGNATIITNAGGSTYFYGSSHAANAQFDTSAGGVVDFSGLNGAGTHASSIAGAGTYNLGANQLILNIPASKTVSGTINDGGASGGTGASLYVTYGISSPPPFQTLTLSGLNTHTGGTTVDRIILGVSAGTQTGTNFSSVGSGDVTLLNSTFKNVSGGSLIFDNNFKLGASFPIAGPLIGTAGGTVDTSGGNLTIKGSIADFSSLGSLAVTGGGSLTLSGTNTYTGATKINAGTLAGGATNSFSSSSAVTVAAGAYLDLGGFDQRTGSLAGAGTVTNSGIASPAALTTGGDNTTTTFSGVIQDGVSTTALVREGIGTTHLTGTNTYTGGTTITGGTLQLGDVSNSGKIAGSVSNHATFNVFNADTSAITSLVNAGNTNFYNNTNAGNISITNNANLVFNNTSSASHSSIIGGGNVQFFDTSTAGSASFNNSGNIQFLYNSTAGNASITNNYITQFLDSSTAGNATITNNSIVDFRFGSTAGNATITNNNIIEFSGQSTAGNATFINNAPLFFGGSLYFLQYSTGGQARFINNFGATVDFSGTDGATFDGRVTAGSIEGAGNYILGSKQLTVGSNNISTNVSGIISGSGGSLVKTGTGTLTLSGTNTYTGDTNVDAGTLLVNGSIASSASLFINAGATLGGTGFIPATFLASGATLAPGTPSAIGTLTVNDNLTFCSCSYYTVKVSPTNADKTLVQGASGTANLAGTIQAIGIGGIYTVGQQYLVLHANGGLGGTTFSGLSYSGSFGATKPKLVYDPNGMDVYLQMVQAQIVPQLPAGFTSNGHKVAGAIDNFLLNGGSLSSAFNNLLNLTGSALTNALIQISGEAGAHGGTQAGLQMTNSFLTLLLNPFGSSPGGNPGSIGIGRGFAAERELPPEVASAYAAVTPKDAQSAKAGVGGGVDHRWGIWGQTYGGYNKTGGDTITGSHDTTARAYGFATGLDYRVSPDILLGFALAGGSTSWGLSEGLGGGKSDVFQMGVYGSKQFGPAYISAALSYAWHWMNTDRTVTVSGTDKLTADFIAHSFGGRLESGYRFDTSFVGITPYAAVQAQNFRTPAYSETAASGSNAFALAYDSKTTTATRTELGAWFDKTVALNTGALMTLRTRAAWTHDHSTNQGATAAFQTLPGSNFTVNGAGTVPNSALLSASGEIKLANGVSIGAKFDGEFASRSQTYAGTGTVTYVW